MPEVAPGGVQFVSKEEAIARMEKPQPELVENLSTNPLPHAFEITPRNADDVSSDREPDRGRGRTRGVEKVSYAKKVADRILRVRLGRLGGLPRRRRSCWSPRRRC